MNIDILLITVNEHEDRELRLCLKENSYEFKEFQGDSREVYSDYGSINDQRVFLATSEMGSFTDGASYKTTKNAISDLKPQLIICVGIAWGGDEEKQNIGDILIPSAVQLGNNAKITEDEIIFRGPKPPTNSTALKILKRYAKSHDFKFHSGTIISKEDLFDNKKLRDKALSAVPERAIGGEMEASGVFQAIEDARECGVECNYIVVKAICDWGYKKSLNTEKKEKDQKLAAQKAAMLITNSITQYRFVRKSAPKISPSTRPTKSTPATFDEAKDGKLISLLNCHAELNFDVIYSNDVRSVKPGTIVYWPVRLRRPNIVHAAQTYVAAFLLQRGFRVRLCLDDLGSPDGYPNKSQGLKDFIKKINQWAAVVADAEIAKDICDNHLLFSKFLERNDKTEPEIKVLAKLGDNLVEWLLAADKLQVVLQHTKLLNDGDKLNDRDKFETLLKKKPRKLLSPAVVWTILDVVIDHREARMQCVTLGGSDEFLIWRACPQRENLDIVSIFLPKVEGSMDTESLRPLATSELENSLNTIPSIKEWVIPYLILFPAICAEQEDMVNRDWKSASNKELAQAVFKFYS